ncbi:PD-(D/E)XK motif protein [Streptomyces sp. NBC_01465]|uniref:PD-(D/E)XK motif protein n=1 Tax=Streptomyces sp. NBC_01465 TaxID=2903878 RepID=UPI002E374FE6|nr:PD-(D/E)XK motif protein [Streptomyces sp. NBC_01465]
MTENPLRRAIEDRWAELESRPVTGERKFRVAELSIATVNGSVATAIDQLGHRHILVPIKSNQQLRNGLNGPVLQVRRRPLEDADTYRVYADLGCLKPEFNELFTRLCTDILVETEQVPENPLKALYKVIDRWKALFRSVGAPLGPEQVAGLFGELSVLSRLLELDPSAHRLWQGPKGHRHDFAGAAGALEVKVSTVDEGRRPRIHGLDQLEEPTNGPLELVWMRLRRTQENGTGLVELVEHVLNLSDDESAVLALLAEVGYRPADAALNGTVRFETAEERWYRVDASFPKLTEQQLAQAGVPLDAMNVDYTIDLSGEQPAPMAEEERLLSLQELLREGS